MDRISFESLEPSADHLLMEHNGIPFTGVAVEYGPNQAVVAEVSYVNGQRSGCAREWSTSGRVLRDRNFRFDSLDGESREWAEDGTLRVEAVYELGICTRKKEWDGAGKLVVDFHLAESDPQFKTLFLLRKNCAK